MVPGTVGSGAILAQGRVRRGTGLGVPDRRDERRRLSAGFLGIGNPGTGSAEQGNVVVNGAGKGGAKCPDPGFKTTR